MSAVIKHLEFLYGKYVAQQILKYKCHRLHQAHFWSPCKYLPRKRKFASFKASHNYYGPLNFLAIFVFACNAKVTQWFFLLHLSCYNSFYLFCYLTSLWRYKWVVPYMLIFIHIYKCSRRLAFKNHVFVKLLSYFDLKKLANTDIIFWEYVQNKVNVGADNFLVFDDISSWNCSKQIWIDINIVIA